MRVHAQDRAALASLFDDQFRFALDDLHGLAVGFDMGMTHEGIERCPSGLFNAVLQVAEGCDRCAVLFGQEVHPAGFRRQPVSVHLPTLGPLAAPGCLLLAATQYRYVLMLVPDAGP